jgi:aldose sugar dehydrogenase
VHDAGQGGLLDVLVADSSQVARSAVDQQRSQVARSAIDQQALAATQTVWISYAAGTAAANHTAVSSLQLELSSGAATPLVRSHRLLYQASPSKSGSVHYGGRLFVYEQMLMLSLGDGFDYREAAQDRQSHLGKIMALDPSGQRAPQIYSLGHRNVQGLIAVGGQLWAHEHGPRGGDELNRIERGMNYGWPAISAGLDYSGAQVTPFVDYPGFRAPDWTWTPSIAPSGMLRYEGTMFPEWQGQLLITTLAARALYRVELAEQRVRKVEAISLANDAQRWRDIELAADGSVYLLSDGNDAALYQLRRLDTRD